MKFFFGPMSKNVVDSIIEFSLINPEIDIVFISSRRQIEYNGGYVNNWTTNEFVKYVKEKNSKIKIERDHSGPSQGINIDDGFESLKEDAKYMDIIHIDPWKYCDNIEDGIEWTAKMILFCDNINPLLEYEIATEEAIYQFSVTELEYIINKLKIVLSLEIFQKIKYLVIQCGTKLSTGENIGSFDENKLNEMLALSKKHNLIAKEHNGDWVNNEIIKRKQNLGLTSINIAPEMGEIETKVILKYVRNNTEDYDKIYDLCIESGKWKKWVKSDFDYINEKDKIILITGHYIFSHPEFQKIKEKYDNIDLEIKEDITNRLLELYGFYSIRDECIFCESTDLKTLFENDYKTCENTCMNEMPIISNSIPYNLYICSQCNTAQNKYLVNIINVYKTNHIDNYGNTKNKKHSMFKDFIVENKNIDGLIEVGACHGELSKLILEEKLCEYTIIEPSFTGDKTNLHIIPDYIENVDLQEINTNTIILSDVFEHFYNPKDFLLKIQKSNNIEYVYLNHPDFDYAVKNNILINLNTEHTFLIEHQFLFQLFAKYGFVLNRRYDFYNFSIFLEFKRASSQIVNNSIYFKNISTHNDVKQFFNKIIDNVNFINNLMDNNPDCSFYLWPCAWYSITLFTLGLNYNKLTGILDNSPNKIGKYLNQYSLLCLSFKEIIESQNENIYIILSCSQNYINELDIDNLNVKFVNL